MIDHGVLSLREQAAFALTCRRCEEPSCVAACRFDALEKQEDGTLKRYNMRCVSCKCCSHACPFGTIYPETVPYFANQCDFCKYLAEGKEPPCIIGCVKEAISFAEVEASPEEDIHIINDCLAVKLPKWEKKDV